MKKVLTIAGSDSSGGAGIQADLKTMSAWGVYGMSAITALTAQNTTGVYGIMEVEPDFVAAQLDCVFGDIFPDAVKIGMLSSAGVMKAVAEKLREYKPAHVVLDPVMVSTSGSRLMKEEAEDALRKELFPLAEILTPNIPEAEVLSGMKIENETDMERAAEMIYEKYGCTVLCKGGHRVNDADDFLLGKNHRVWIRGKRIENPNTHGTGCTLSSAIACALAQGNDLEQAVRKAKEYLSGALEDGMDLGKGSGPLNHAFQKKEENR